MICNKIKNYVKYVDEIMINMKEYIFKKLNNFS